MSDKDDRKGMAEGLGILDVKAALEDVFKGCDVKTPGVGNNSHHAEVKFNEYEIRVILSGTRSPTRDIHFRFMQRIKPAGRSKLIKVLITEMSTQDPKELMKAIRGSREYLLGIVQAINRALKRKPVPQVLGIDDLLTGA
jgi:hypothetical protein